MHEGVVMHSKFIEFFGPALNYLKSDGTEPGKPDPKG
jgi:hypothetical protein